MLIHRKKVDAETYGVFLPPFFPLKENYIYNGVLLI